MGYVDERTGDTIIRYDPHPSAVAIHNSEAKTKCVIGPVGSGKTSIGCMEFYQMCAVATVPIRGVVIRESYRELQDSTRKTWEEWFGDLSEYRAKDDKALITLPGPDGVERTHELFFRACRKESEATKFLSTEFAFIWLEEVVPAYTKKGVMGQGLPKGIFDVAHMRIRQKGAPYLQVLITANPPSTRHWVYQEFFLRSPDEMERKRYALFRQPAFENKDYLPENYYEDLQEILSPDMYRRFVGGEVVPIYDGVRVFPEAIDNYHIIETVDPLPGIPLVLGQDYGLTPCTLITQLVPGGQWRWLKELQVWNSGMKKYMEFLVPLLRGEFRGYDVRVIWQDNKGGNVRSQTDESTCKDILTSAGFTVQDGKDEWALRKELMKQRFEFAPMGQPGVLISRYGCPIASEALLGGYRYPKSSEGLVGSVPLKNDFSHLMDCAQMIATGEFEVLSGTARMDATERRQRLAPPYNPLSSAPRQRSTHRNWMAR